MQIFSSVLTLIFKAGQSDRGGERCPLQPRDPDHHRLCWSCRCSRRRLCHRFLFFLHFHDFVPTIIMTNIPIITLQERRWGELVQSAMNANDPNMETKSITARSALQITFTLLKIPQNLPNIQITFSSFLFIRKLRSFSSENESKYLDS